MKKKLSMMFTATLVILTLFNTPVHAAESKSSLSDGFIEAAITSEDGAATVKIYDLKDLASEIIPEKGIITPSIAIGEGELKKGYSMAYSNPDGSSFYAAAGTSIKFTVTLKSSAHVEMGYIDSAGYLNQTYNDTAKTNTTNIYIGKTGYYNFYIKNVSSDTIKITGGSIEY